MIYCRFRRHDEEPQIYIARSFKDLAHQLTEDGRKGFALKVYASNWNSRVVGRIWHDGIAIGWVEEQDGGNAA